MAVRAVVATMAALVVLAGCGEGGSSPAAPSTSASTSSSTSGQSATVPSHPSKSRPAPAAEKKAPARNPPDRSAPTTPTDSAPLPNQGTKAVAPGVPTKKGGDNSIQAYGLEAASQERVEVAAIVQAYLAAQAAGRWGAACAHLTDRVRTNLEALARRVPGGAEDCAGEMATLLAKAPEGALRRAAQIHILSFRAQGDQGFVVYRDGTGKPFNLPLTRQGGEWRIGALVGIGLVL